MVRMMGSGTRIMIAGKRKMGKGFQFVGMKMPDMPVGRQLTLVAMDIVRMKMIKREQEKLDPQHTGQCQEPALKFFNATTHNTRSLKFNAYRLIGWIIDIIKNFKTLWQLFVRKIESKFSLGNQVGGFLETAD